MSTTRENGNRVNVMHLVTGLVFLGISGSWALHAAEVIDTVEVRWILPLVLVAAGAAGLVASLAKGLGGRRREPDVEPLDTEEPLTTYDEP